MRKRLKELESCFNFANWWDIDRSKGLRINYFQCIFIILVEWRWVRHIKFVVYKYFIIRRKWYSVSKKCGSSVILNGMYFQCHFVPHNIKTRGWPCNLVHRVVFCSCHSVWLVIRTMSYMHLIRFESVRVLWRNFAGLHVKLGLLDNHTN